MNLKKCPFCGGEIFDNYCDYERKMDFSCTNCDYDLSFGNLNSEQEGITKWNNRNECFFHLKDRFFTSDYEIYSGNDERIVQINNEDFYVRKVGCSNLTPIYKIGDEKSEFMLNEIEYLLENTNRDSYEESVQYEFETLTLQQLKNIREIFTTYMNKSEKNKKRFNYFIKELEKHFCNMKQELYNMEK
jgi:hypothetical protein